MLCKNSIIQLALKHKCLDKAAFGLKHGNTARRLSDLGQNIASAADRPAKRDKSIAATGGQEGRNPWESHVTNSQMLRDSGNSAKKRNTCWYAVLGSNAKIGDSCKGVSCCNSLDNSVL